MNKTLVVVVISSIIIILTAFGIAVNSKGYHGGEDPCLPIKISTSPDGDVLWMISKRCSTTEVNYPVYFSSRGTSTPVSERRGKYQHDIPVEVPNN